MFPSSSKRSWTSFLLSAAVHVALLATVVQLSRERVEEPAERRGEETDPGRQVQMVYLDPPPAPKERPPEPPRPAPPQPRPPRPVAPAPEKEQRTPEPDANAPPEAARAEGEERENDAPDGGRNAGAAPRSSAESEAATMESEARRIFGRPRLGTLPGAGPRAVRPMEAILPENAKRCVPTPRPPADSAGTPQYGVVVGRIFRKDNGLPLAGAHLQMLGTPYVSFTDASGEYRFRFDLALVDNCRTQYVRVTADGYESRLLVLVVGDNVRSEDVLLRPR